jgi:hypothetical protein
MRRKLSPPKSEYTVNEYSGILLFKIIITEAQVDTKSTTTLMWQLSAGLPDMMAECGSNVKAFNQEYVASKETDRPWSKCSDNSPQLLLILMRQEGRKVLCYMEQLENAYTDGTVQLDTSILMSKAENKYAELIEKHEFTGR